MLVPEIWPVSRSSQLVLMRDHGLTTAKYEWMFWDAGWRRETWPI
jgi:thiaminase/transcriptional activator TenA